MSNNDGTIAIDDFEAVKQRAETAEREAKALRDENRIFRALVCEADAQDCIDPVGAATICAKGMRVVDGQIVDAAGRPPAEVISSFLVTRGWMLRANNPEYVRRAGQSQSESEEQIVGRYFGKKSNSKAANDLARTNKAEYMRLRAIAVRLGLVP